MKKTLLVIGLVLAAGLLFTSESPSLDGRAVVADEGVFPRGLFAKTVGYLPGDSISVTNPANGERVEILVIGSLDPSDGVAVLLSPEAAESLNIKRNSNNLVKLTKRNGAADEVVNGSAVLTNDGSAYAEDYTAPAEQKTIEHVVEEAIENNIPVEEAVASAVEQAEEAVADKAFDEAEAKAEEAAAEEAAVAEAETAAEEAAVAEEIVEDEIVEDELAEDASNGEELVVDELAAAEDKSDDDDIIEDTVIDESLDEFDAIVLVPSESKAPEAAESEPKEEDVVILPPSDTNPAPAVKKSTGVAYVNGYGDLADKKYYVQIAVYKSAENVEEIADKYSERYPITVVQQGSKSPVLVGPLNVDEYGVILERFRSYGFKDAFVKIGKAQGSKPAYDAADFER